MDEPRHWPRLAPDNLHPFRIRVKQLRSLLQLAEHQDRSLLEILRDAKDELGNWHDWRELVARSDEILHRNEDGIALRTSTQIHKRAYCRAKGAAERAKSAVEKGGESVRRNL
jgi:CHAD domain-containing protein